jgi:hypothetical protein
VSLLNVPDRPLIERDLLMRVTGSDLAGGHGDPPPGDKDKDQNPADQDDSPKLPRFHGLLFRGFNTVGDSSAFPQITDGIEKRNHPIVMREYG